MNTLQDTFYQIQDAKKKQREIRSLYREALKKSHDYQEVMRESRTLQEKKRLIEQKIKTEFSRELDTLDDLIEEVKVHNEKLTNMVLSHITKGEVVKVRDMRNNSYDPLIRVVFKKSDEQETE